ITLDTRVGAGAGAYPYNFDDDGRCIRDDRFVYVYDAMDRLVQAKALPTLNIVLSQEFDPAGRVIRRMEGASTYQLAFFGYRLLQRSDGGGHPVRQFSVGVGVDEVILESGTANYYPLQDSVSSVLAYADSSGSVVERCL